MQTDDHQLRRRLYPWVGVLAGLVLVVAAAWAADFIPGDVNDDGVFDVLDPTVLRRELAGLEPGVSQMCRAELPATGQVTCWHSSGTIIPCAGTGQDGDAQAGAPLAYRDTGDGTITDLNTGLMWEKLSDDGSIHDWDDLYTWDLAFSLKVATLNSTTFAGHTDWRLPNIKELVSIVNYELSFPYLSPAFNHGCTPGCTVLTCSCMVGSVYYSSSTNARSPAAAWSMDFTTGKMREGDKSVRMFVRAVRDVLAGEESSCVLDTDCGTDSWCRVASDPAIMECVQFQQEGGFCGGFTLPSAAERCPPDLICTDFPPFIADAPGVCRRPCRGVFDCDLASTCHADDICRPRCAENTDCPFSFICDSLTGICSPGPCASDGECTSLNCVDGICCNSPCSGVCESCLSTHTGSPDGTCAFITTGTDPDSECAGPATCGSDGVPGVCGCQPTTSCKSVACGPLDDGCGAVLNCGTCVLPERCIGGVCIVR